MSKKYLFPILIMAMSLEGTPQCVADTTAVYSFNYNNSLYEIVKENKTWAEASACAVSRGGKLAEINSETEQDTLFYYLNQAGILPANTVAPDGGGASYVWLGGNDLAAEGSWMWDGKNAGSTDQFWQGTSSGSAVNGSYTNWGNEPDNWNGQDGLGLAIVNWPLGLAGQWNDVDETNQLYYVIEHPEIITTNVREVNTAEVSVYPNPAQNFITVNLNKASENKNYSVTNLLGIAVLEGELGSRQNQQIDLGSLEAGIYYLVFDRQAWRIVKFIKR